MKKPPEKKVPKGEEGKTLMEVFGLLGAALSEPDIHPFAPLLRPQEGVHGPGPSDWRDWALVAYSREPGSSNNVRVTFFRASGTLPADHPELLRLNEAFEKIVRLDFQREHESPVDMDVAMVRIDPNKEPRNYIERSVNGQIEVLASSQTDGRFLSRPIPVIDLRPGKLRSDKPRQIS